MNNWAICCHGVVSRATLDQVLFHKALLFFQRILAKKIYCIFSFMKQFSTLRCFLKASIYKCPKKYNHILSLETIAATLKAKSPFRAERKSMVTLLAFNVKKYFIAEESSVTISVGTDIFLEVGERRCKMGDFAL